MSYNYPGQQQYSQSQGHPGRQQQYPAQGQAPQYTHGNPPPAQQPQYGQPSQGYPQQQGNPARGHSPAPQGHSPAAAGPQVAYSPQGYTPATGAPRPGYKPDASGSPPPDSGAFPGGHYAITHRDSNTILTVNLQAQGAFVKSAPGAMVEMAGTVALTGKTKFSFSKMLTGGEMHESSYTGRGDVVLAPTLPGDIVALHIDGRTPWRIGKDAYLASSGDVIKENKMQGLGKALFSGEDLFVYNVHGNGVMWLKSFGAITKRELQPGQQHVVDNGHLVAWNMDYKIEKAGGGLLTARKTGEGLVCRFQGPGTVYIQTRNQEAFEDYIRSIVPSTGG